MNMISDKKVILLGLDGATWTQLNPHISMGLMPNLLKLIDNGVKGILNSTVPYTSRACWLSILTGTNPGKHGIPHHTVGGKHEVPRLWDILTEKKMKQLIVNDLITYPPSPIDGVMISGGFSTPSTSKDFTYPISIMDEINKIVENYTPSLSAEILQKTQEEKFDEFYNKLQEWGNNVVKISTNLEKNHEWQLFAPIIENTDYINHFFWDKPEFLKKFFIWLDDVIGKFNEIAKKNNANLIIVSDHGGGPIKKHFLINTWLQQSGFTNFTKPNKIRKILSKTGIKRKDVRSNLSKLHLRGIASKITTSEIRKMVPIDKNESGVIDVNSKVFSEAYDEITVNIENSIEYEKTRNKLIEKLENLKDDEGNFIVSKVYKREESFHEPFVNRAHDLQFVLNEGYCYSSAIREKYILTPEEIGRIRTGDHRPEGIFLGSGPDFEKGKSISGLQLWDICPIILHCLELEIPSYMDGTVPKELFSQHSSAFKREIFIKNEIKKDFSKKQIDNKINEYSKEDEDEIKKVLDEMGYT